MRWSAKSARRMILSFCRVLFGKDCTRISHRPPSNASGGILRAQTPRDAQRIIRLLPIILSALLLVAAIALSYISWHERHIEQQRFEAMTAQANSYIAKERDYLLEMINSHDTFDRNNSETWQPIHSAIRSKASMCNPNGWCAIRSWTFIRRTTRYASSSGNYGSILKQKWTMNCYRSSLQSYKIPIRRTTLPFFFIFASAILHKNNNLHKKCRFF